MEPEYVRLYERFMRSKGCLKSVYGRLLLVIGLYSLLRLQFEHEGHMDENVTELLIGTLHNVEQELSDMNQELFDDPVPF
jgi:hypothetical protein